MGDLAVDTAVSEMGEPGDDGTRRFAATLDPDWEIWGPMGGYVAAVALRAAGVAGGRARPAAINGHFLGGVGSGPVEVTATVNRATRVATSVRVTVTQGERTGFTALVWGVDDLDGLEHHTDRRPPPAPPPEAVPTYQERMRSQGIEEPPHPFWQNLDYRPVDWVPEEDYPRGTPGLPATRDCLYRLVPTATFTDPWVDGGRLAIIVDLDSWPAAARPFGWEADYFAPTVELTARFHQDAAGEPWLRAVAEAPVAAGGLIGATGEVWSLDGRLLASGGSTLLCRPAEKRPDR